MKRLIQTALLAVLATVAIRAQDLTYKPKNPAFGGDTFNYNWMLSSAQAQDTFKDPTATSFSDRTSTAGSTTLNDFTTTLNRLLLSQISQQLINSQFGEDGLKPGSYTLGNFSINVGPSTDGIIIDISDLTNGQTTQVVIPFF